MAKAMAVITNGTVTNIIWCSDSQLETDTLKSPGERPVGIGDTYSGGKWYRGGIEILTPRESAYAAQNAELLDALATMVEDVYNQDIESIEEE